jgi:hypothetical protein
LYYDSADTYIQGGADSDTLLFTSTDAIDLSSATHISSIEHLTWDAAVTTGSLTLSSTSVDAIAGAGLPLYIDGAAGNSVNLMGAWVQGAQAGNYTLYTKSGASLYIHNDIFNANGVNMI